MKYNLILIALIGLFLSSTQLKAEETEYPAYYRITTVNGSIGEYSTIVKTALEEKGFTIVGEYNPANDDSLYVICYTSQELAEVTLKFTDRGALASVLKVGLKQNKEGLDITMLNPQYLFYAYLIDNIEPYEAQLIDISDKAKSAMRAVGSDFEPFGGAMTKDDLDDYRYKIMMPYFTDPEELQEFSSFEEGLETIRKNLKSGKGNTVSVYEVVYPSQKVAVFGVGLLDEEDGEARFLPIIGDDHICALPYDMILQGNELTMLPGRYRIALHWPELSMKTFMKIMSTPGDIEDFLEALSE
jgi:hypothetical protein